MTEAGRKHYYEGNYSKKHRKKLLRNIEKSKYRKTERSKRAYEKVINDPVSKDLLNKSNANLESRKKAYSDYMSSKDQKKRDENLEKWNNLEIKFEKRLTKNVKDYLGKLSDIKIDEYLTAGEEYVNYLEKLDDMVNWWD